jgi:Cupin
MEVGDVTVLRGPDAYVVADDPATAPQAIIHPGQRCTTVDGEELGDQWSLGVRTWGNTADGAAVMLTGTYQLHSEVSGAGEVAGLAQVEWQRRELVGAPSAAMPYIKPVLRSPQEPKDPLTARSWGRRAVRLVPRPAGLASWS